VDLSDDARWAWRAELTSDLKMAKVADGKTFEDLRIRVGEGSAISIWVAGLPDDARVDELRIRLNGSDLPAVWLAGIEAKRQVNALLPAGLEPGSAAVSVVFRDGETQPVAIELYRQQI